MNHGVVSRTWLRRSSTPVMQSWRQLGNDHALYAIAQVVHIEVHQQAGFHTGQAKNIRHVLHGSVSEVGMSRRDNDAALNKKIHPHRTVHAVAFVADRQGVIALKNDFPHAQLQREAVAVSFRHQARSKMAVDLHAGTNNKVGKFLGVKFHRRWKLYPTGG